MGNGVDIILWTCHDMGVACNPFGDHNVATPNLSRLADAGVTYTRNFCTTPLCSPSRGSIQTGRYPHVNGLIGLVNQGWDLPERERCLVHRLADAGYHTTLVGFQHIVADVERLGFDETRLGPDHHQAVGAGETVAALLAAECDRPRYIEVNTSQAHRPLPEPDGSVNLDALEVPPYWPDTPEVRADMAGLYQHVLAIDEGVGRVIDALEASGRAERTLFVFTVDHGVAFPRCKSTLYDSGIHTALLMSQPGRLPAGARVDTLISNVDLCPTLLDLAELPRDRGFDGRSFAKQALGTDKQPHRQWLYAMKDWHDDYDPMRCVRTERWKYIRNLVPGPKLTLAADMTPFRCPSTRAMSNAFLAERPAQELYDLHEDPHELNNLADDGLYSSTLRELSGMLDDWMQQTSDPFLEHGYTPAPALNYQRSVRGRQWWPGDGE